MASFAKIKHIEVVNIRPHHRKIFANIIIGKIFIYPMIFLSSVNDYIEDMAVGGNTAFFCNARVARVGETFVQQKFSAIQ